MDFKRRMFICVALLFGSVLVASGVASATISINPVTTTASSSSATFSQLGGRTSVSCTSSTLVDTIASNGSGTVALGNARFAGCLTSGTVTVVTQGAPWGISFGGSFLLSGGRITGVQKTFIIGAGALSFNINSGFCRFDLVGSIPELIAIRPVTPPAQFAFASLPITGLTFPLTVANAVGAGCAALGIVNGNMWNYTVTYALSVAIVGTLI